MMLASTIQFTNTHPNTHHTHRPDHTTHPHHTPGTGTKTGTRTRCARTEDYGARSRPGTPETTHPTPHHHPTPTRVPLRGTRKQGGRKRGEGGETGLFPQDPTVRRQPPHPPPPQPPQAGRTAEEEGTWGVCDVPLTSHPGAPARSCGAARPEPRPGTGTSRDPGGRGVFECSLERR